MEDNTSFTYILLYAQLKSSILDHVDAVIIISWFEQAFTLL